MNVYYIIDDRDSDKVSEILDQNDINYIATYDSAIVVCDDLTETYIENNVKEELRPLFRRNKEELTEWLFVEADDLIDNKRAIEILNEYPIEDF